MVGQNSFRSVLGDGKTAVRMRRVVPVQPGFVLLHAAAVPAEVMVVCLHVRDAVQAAVLRSIGNMGQGGQAGRIQGFDQLFQVPVILYVALITTILSFPFAGWFATTMQTEFAKIGLLPLCTPILAYAGISAGKDLDTFKKQGFAIVCTALIAFIGTYIGSAIIAQIVLRLSGVI